MQRIRSLSVRPSRAGAFAAFAPAGAGLPFTDVAAEIRARASSGSRITRCTASQYGIHRAPDQMAAFMFRLGNVVHQQGGNAFGATAVLGSILTITLDR